MASTGKPVKALLPSERRCATRSDVLASTVGTAAGWYGIFLLSLVAGLVSITLCSPRSDPLIGIFGAFSIYTVCSAFNPVERAVASWAPRCA
jgi:hypothetical protein